MPFSAKCGGTPNPLEKKVIVPTDATNTNPKGSAHVELQTKNGTPFTATATGVLNQGPTTVVSNVAFTGAPAGSAVVTADIPNLLPGTYVLTVSATDNQDPSYYDIIIGQPTVAACDLLVEKLAVTLPDTNPTAPQLGTATGQLRVRATGPQIAAANPNASVIITLTQGSDQGDYNHPQTVPLGGMATFTGLAAGMYLLTAVCGTCYYPKPVGANPSVPMQIEIPEPPLEIGDQLTFLPWVQSELAAAAAPGTSGRPELRLSAQLRTTDTTQKGATPLDADVGPTAPAQIYGPGDVLGVNLRAILGTTPVPGATGFSALQLAAIEFQEEDLPWRFSTRKTAAGLPAPWCFLLVLTEAEYTRLPQSGQPLPSVQVLSPAAYPSPAIEQQAQWAHVQLNTPLGPPPAKGATTAEAPLETDINTFLTTTLPAHPALAYARVVSPRRLVDNTAYRAFLLPATEAGRLAGLGLPYAPADAGDASFPGKTVAPDIFPIYFEWEFATGAAEDFESLATQLHRANDSTTAALAPTLGLTVAGQAVALPMPALLRDADGQNPDATPVPAGVAHYLWEQLAPAFTAGLPTAVRPLVTPPLYGRAYLVATKLDEPGATIAPSWKHTVNLDPRYRALAAAGAQVVRDKEEEYVRRAWDQVQDILLANDKLRGAQYGLRTTAGLRDQHLPLLTVTTTTTTTTTSATGGGPTNLTGRLASFSSAALAPDEAAAAAEATPDQGVAALDAGTLDEAGILNSATPSVSTSTTLADYGLHLAALSLPRIRVKPAVADSPAPRPTLRETIRQSSTPLAAFSPVFRRLTKPFGPYQVAQAGRPLRATQTPLPLDLARPAVLTTPGTSLRQRDGLFRFLTAGTIAAAPARAEQVRANQFADDVVDRLLLHNGTGLAPSALAGNQVALDHFNAAYRSLRSDGPNPAASPATYVTIPADRTVLGFRKMQRARPALDLEALKDDVIRGTQPGPVFTARVQHVAPTAPVPAVPSPGDFEAPDFNATHFYVGDFDEPAPAVPADWLNTDFRALDFNTGPYVAYSEDPGPTSPLLDSLAAAPEEARFATAALASITGAGTVLPTTTTTTTLTGPVIHTDAELPAIKQAKVFPVFKEAMGEALCLRYPELFVPGLGGFPSGGLAVLAVNQAFIEAYMVGLNHALGSELRWRGFPVEPRATFFQQFWNVGEHLNSQLDLLTAAADHTLETKLLDIKPLDQWIGTALGANAPDPDATFEAAPLRLALRSELLRRYPDLVIGLQPSQLDPASGLPVPDPDTAHLLVPRQRLAVGQDVVVVTFDLTEAKAVAPAATTGAGTGTGAYYLVLMERPGQPTFGLDTGTGTPTQVAPLGWDQLSWDYLGTQPGANITFDFSAGSTAPGSKLPHATAEPKETAYLTDSAVVAYALFQEPILLAVPLAELLG